jgi:hypothetical protein
MPLKYTKLIGKTEHLLNSLSFDLPHIIRLSEHHLKEYKINNILVDNYVLGAINCRSSYKKDGCMYTYPQLN